MALAFVLCAPVSSVSQTSSGPPSQIDSLASRMAGKLDAPDSQTVVVLDLSTAEGKWLPFGEWIADQLSVSLAKQGIHTIDRSQFSDSVAARYRLTHSQFDSDISVEFSRAAGATIAILGSFGAVGNGVGVTLVAYKVPPMGVEASGADRLALIRGKLDLTDSIAAHLSVPLSSLRSGDGIATAGMGGVTQPQCISCVPPNMSGRDVDLLRFLREKGGIGNLELQFTVTADGKTSDVTVVNPVGYGIADVYLKAARDFTFRPAVDADEKPIAVRTRLTFRISTQR
jgi:hypothetical protein